MVYVNSKKFACESCIKGHRSSSCHHTDRPLFEIKKKGRPVSQCEKCRELRQSKKVHSKCTCNPKIDPARRGEVLASVTSKSRRFIPIVPALPNGLRDVLAASEVRTSLPADTRQRVDSLLNPCNCKSVWKCDCLQPQSSTDAPTPESDEDLATLAHVAAMHSFDASAGSSSSSPCAPRDLTAKIALPSTITSSLPISAKRHTSRPTTPQPGSHKRSKRYDHDYNHPSALQLPLARSSTESSSSIPGQASKPKFGIVTSSVSSQCLCGIPCASLKPIERQGNAKDSDGQTGGKHRTYFENHNHIQDSPSPPLELPPIQSSTESSLQIPDFGFMPPISTITSFAGSGCTCGVQCACPGCVEHRGIEHAAKDLHDCMDGKCRTCVDNQLGIALPSSTSPYSSTSAASASASTSVDFVNNSVSLNRFFARAAALPPPPLGRRMRSGARLDPHDVGFGLGNASSVKLPKLECCGGSCSCPNGQCVCGRSCAGCCAGTYLPSHPAEATAGTSPALPVRSDPEVNVMSQSPLAIPGTSQGSCCG